MSSNGSESARRVEDKLRKIDQLYEDMVSILRNDPQCLDEISRKDEILEMLEVRLTTMLETPTVEAKPYMASVAMVAVYLDCLDGYEDKKSNQDEYFWKALEYLLSKCAMEMQWFPDELKSRAYDIFVNGLREKM